MSILREMFVRLGFQVDDSSVKKAESAVASIRNGIFAIKAAAIGLAGSHLVHSFREMVASVAEHAEALEHASKITGMAANKIQELEYAAKRSNVSAEELRMGLVHLARSANEAATSGGQAAYDFQQLGIQIADAATGKLRPLGDILADVSDKLAKMPDGTQKAAMAMQFFGRGGSRLIPVLNDGSAGLAKMGAEARALGVVMDDKALAAGQRYQASLERMQAAVQGVKNAIAARLFPAMTQSTEQFIAWTTAHRRWIALRVQEAFESVSRVLHTFAQVGKAVIDVLQGIWRAGGAVKGILIGLALVAAAIMAPWTALVAVLALVAEDIAGYFEGKNSITGRVVFAFKRMAIEVRKAWDLFSEDPFGFLYKAARTFFDWFVEQAARLPERIAAATKAAFTAGAGGVKPAEVAFAGLSGVNRFMLQAPNVVAEAFVDSLRAFFSSPAPRAGTGTAAENTKSSPFAPGRASYNPLTELGYLRDLFSGPSMVTPALPAGMAGMLPGSSAPVFHIEVNNPPPGTDGKQLGRDIGAGAREQWNEWRDADLREAAAHVKK